MSVASFVDVCRFTATSSGTGDFVVNAAVTGYQTPASAGAANGAIYRYRAESSNLAEWEVGYGAYTSGSVTLARTTILFSSTGSKVSFSAAPQVALVCLAEDLGALPLQVVQTVDTTNRSTASTSFVSSSVAASITPVNSANKVRIQVVGIVGADAGAGVFFTLFRNAVDLTPASTTELQGFVISGNTATQSLSVDLLDSPATTSSTTYTLYWKVNTSTGRLGRRGVDTLFNSPTIITLTEVRG